MQYLKSNLVLLLVLAFFMVTGFFLAAKKKPWGDELFSLTSSISNRTYGEIILGQVKEGNNAPLFYIAQKAFFDLIGYKAPQAWLKGDPDFVDFSGQIYLRILPVFWMSLGGAIMVAFFWNRFGWVGGLWSFLLLCSASSFWQYMAESRHYGLWVLLSIVQGLTFLELAWKRGQDYRLWRQLILVNVFLAFTVFLSLGQALCILAALWMVTRDVRKRWFMAAAGPILISFYYYAVNVERYKFTFATPADWLIRAHFPQDKMLVLFVFLLCLLTVYVQKRWTLKAFLDREEIRKGKAFFIASILMLGYAWALVGVFKWMEVPGKGFEIANRYFIFLMPFAVISSSFLSIAVWRSLKAHRWLQLMSGGVFFGFMMARLVKAGKIAISLLN